jgi:phosphopantothenate--cysteine ligase
MRVLITGGGCEEAVDSVRCITNFATGQTASVIADTFVSKKAEVTAVMGRRAFLPKNSSVEIVRYGSFLDLSRILQDQLSKNSYDVVLHASAVSDYGVESVLVNGKPLCNGAQGKLDSDSDIIISLKKHPKLIDVFKTWSMNPGIKIIGFKLTAAASLEERESAVAKLFDRARVDWIVSNDLSEIGGDFHNARIYKSGQLIGEAETKQELAMFLWKIVGGE